LRLSPSLPTVESLDAVERPKIKESRRTTSEVKKGVERRR
jgi:hypothetical protein